jgi:hypothetical protein
MKLLILLIVSTSAQFIEILSPRRLNEKKQLLIKFANGSSLSLPILSEEWRKRRKRKRIN